MGKNVPPLGEHGRALEASAWLQAVVENSDDAILSKTLDGVITTWNRGAARLFGFAAQEAVGRPITILIPEERLAEEEDILRRLRAGERVDHFETVRRRKDGELVEVSLTVAFATRTSAASSVPAAAVAADAVVMVRAVGMNAEPTMNTAASSTDRWPSRVATVPRRRMLSPAAASVARRRPARIAPVESATCRVVSLNVPRACSATPLTKTRVPSGSVRTSRAKYSG